MSNLRFALVGCGSIARKHAHVLHNYLDEAEIGAFVDLDGARACEFSRKFEAPGFTSVDEMMRRVGDRIDVINVLTPSGAHCENVLDLVQYGRPLVVEKPLALRLEDADRMIKACDAHGVKLFVRSEEHTSELQSLTNLVCRLLLEKKKKQDRWQRDTSAK